MSVDIMRFASVIRQSSRRDQNCGGFNPSIPKKQVLVSKRRAIRAMYDVGCKWVSLIEQSMAWPTCTALRCHWIVSMKGVVRSALVN